MKSFLPLPSNGVPDAFTCVALPIPDDPEAAGLVWGALYQLSVWSSYDRDDDHTGKGMADLWKQILDQLHDTIGSLPGDCRPEGWRISAVYAHIDRYNMSSGIIAIFRHGAFGHAYIAQVPPNTDPGEYGVQVIFRDIETDTSQRAIYVDNANLFNLGSGDLLDCHFEGIDNLDQEWTQDFGSISDFIYGKAWKSFRVTRLLGGFTLAFTIFGPTQFLPL